MDANAKTGAKATISVVVTRADGRVDDYGIVSSSSLWFRTIGRHLVRIRTYWLNRRV